jgi:protein-disulfide isomerase
VRSTIKTSLTIFSLVALAGGVAAYNARAAEKEAGLTDIQKSEVQQVIKEYIRANPELVIESLQAYQQKQQEQSLTAAKEKISKYQAELIAKNLPSGGNPNGDVTVIEFFDYNCGYCKKAFSDIQKVIESDKNVRFVFFDMPILGPSSLIAAKWSHAAHKQGKFFEFHTALMEHNGGIDDSVVADLAKKVGLDVDQAKKDAEDPALNADLERYVQMGHDIGIQGTPGFIVGDELYPGYLGEDGLAKAVEKARAGKKS